MSRCEECRIAEIIELEAERACPPCTALSRPCCLRVAGSLPRREETTQGE